MRVLPCVRSERKRPCLRRLQARSAVHDGQRKAEDPFCLRVRRPILLCKDVKESLHRFKFGGCTGNAKAYAPYVADCIRDAFGTEFDVLS